VRRTIGLLVAGLLALAGAIGATTAHAASWTSSSYASRLVQLVNQARQQHGLPALTVTSGTSQVAGAWTAHLDASQSLAHNPDLRHQLETHGSPDWTTYGENVGQGPSGDPDALFKAYMNSTEHRDNILNGKYRYTGVAVVLDGSTAWNTFDFVDTYHSATRTSSTPSPKPKPKPSASATQPAPAPSSTGHVSAFAPATATASGLARSAGAAARSAEPAQPRVTHVRRVAQPLPHTAARSAVDTLPNLARMLSVRDQHTVVLAASVRSLPASFPASSRVSIALAGLLVGFVGVRWWNVARGTSRAPRDLVTA
jgi:Cysteine-rich secretory protein family